MSSFRSRFFVFMLKHQHLLKGQLRRTERIDPETSIPALREMVEKSAKIMGKLPKGFAIEPESIDGRLNAEWVLPPEAAKDRAILYFHGGGLVVGSARAHRGIVAKFVKGSGIPALCFDYGLAPENPFPRGLEDSLAAYEFLLQRGIPSDRIVFMGDSGGGNLVLATMLALKERKRPLPAGAVALSPWTDLTNSGPSWKDNEPYDTLTWKESQKVFARYYTGGNDPTEPLISPLYGDLSGLPPIRLYAGGHELMLSDSTRFHEKACAAGVDSRITIGESLFHCYPACAPMFPEATEAMKEICAFAAARCNEKPVTVAG
jgi:acetyl esterase/lipase